MNEPSTLAERIQIAHDKMSLNERRVIMVKAKILKQDGYLDERFFSEKTIAKDKKRSNVSPVDMSYA